MIKPDTIRTRIALQLKAGMTTSSINYTEIADATGLDLRVITNAVSYGIADTGDLSDICQALDLDPVAVITNALRAAADSQWQTTIPPTDRRVEINYYDAILRAQYLADRKAYLIGHDSLITLGEAPQWREVAAQNTWANKGAASTQSAEPASVPERWTDPRAEMPDCDIEIILITNENKWGDTERFFATWNGEQWIDGAGSSYETDEIATWRHPTQAEEDTQAALIKQLANA